MPVWDERGTVAALLAALAVLSLVVTVLTRETFDDPWILYRYAENVAAGYGWVYNPGDGAAATANAVTSPLAVLVLAAGVKVGLPVALWSAVLFAAGFWAAAAGLLLTMRRWGHLVAGVGGGVLLLCAPPLVSLRGMETPIFLGLLSMAMFAVAARRSWLLGLLLGFAVLARPDAAVFLAAVVVFLTVRDRRVPWRTAAAAAAVIAVWVVVSIPLTGSVLPSTLAAKTAQAESRQWPGFLWGVLFQMPREDGLTLWFAAALPLGLVGAVAAVRWRLAELLPLVGGAVAIAVAYGVVLNVAMYPWYPAPLEFLLVWLVGLGVEVLVRAAQPSWARVVVAMVLALVFEVAAAQTPKMAPFRQQQEQVGLWLRANTPPGATVAAAEIGRLGYFSQREMVDYLGLLDPSAVPHVRVADWTWWPQQLHPDYWVTFRPDTPVRFPFDDRVRDQPGFTEVWKLVMMTDELAVYQRR